MENADPLSGLWWKFGDSSSQGVDRQVCVIASANNCGTDIAIIVLDFVNLNVVWIAVVVVYSSVVAVVRNFTPRPLCPCVRGRWDLVEAEGCTRISLIEEAEA